ncbi:hypothetical protein HDV00_008565 [Rhizophlyctis rosea]|nr:hypothetical protein HDV00_008565 [Rhizophlyctis rosea]
MAAKELTTAFRGSSFGNSIGGSPLKDLPAIDGPDFGEDAPFNDAEMTAAAMQREMGAFLTYVKEIAHKAGTDSVQFLDLIPPMASNRKAATEAFSHLLALSNDNVLKPTQLEPYGDIQITLVASMA